MTSREDGRENGHAADDGAAPSKAFLPWSLAAVFAALYLTDSLNRHAKMRSTGYDLGIFEQGVRAYSRFHAPVAPLKGPGTNLLGDHFHPWLAALGPLYRLWPDARLLLITQALLIAVSVVPIGRLAIARLGTAAGVAVMTAYGLSWGFQGAVSFDFHEVALAVPLLAFALVALLEERWFAAVCWTLPLLLVKEDQGLTVAAVGGYLLLKRRWRTGAALTVGGLGAVALVTMVIIPFFSSSGDYGYWNSLSSGTGEHSSKGIFETLADFPGSFAEHPEKLKLLLLIGLTTAFAALRSPIFGIALPTIGYRLLSTSPLHWGVGRVHYNAVLMPILFVALVDAVCRMRESPSTPLRWYARAAVPLSLVIGLVSLPWFEFRELVNPHFYRTSPHIAAARKVIGMIPDDSSVAASNFLVPQLTGRCEVVLFPNFRNVPVDWVVVDTKRPSTVPVPIAQIPQAIAALPQQGFHQITDQDGVILWRKNG